MTQRSSPLSEQQNYVYSITAPDLKKRIIVCISQNIASEKVNMYYHAKYLLREELMQEECVKSAMKRSKDIYFSFVNDIRTMPL